MKKILLTLVFICFATSALAINFQKMDETQKRQTINSNEHLKAFVAEKEAEGGVITDVDFKDPTFKKEEYIKVKVLEKDGKEYNYKVSSETGNVMKKKKSRWYN
jgi:uncharacterized membrane protein YkoI